MKRAITITIDAGDTKCDGCDYLIGSACRLYRDTAGRLRGTWGDRLPECLQAEQRASALQPPPVTTVHLFIERHCGDEEVLTGELDRLTDMRRQMARELATLDGQIAAVRRAVGIDVDDTPDGVLSPDAARQALAGLAAREAAR
jgi:hypothetical protein